MKIVHVPFKGGGPAMADVIAGNTQLCIGSLIQMDASRTVRAPAGDRDRWSETGACDGRRSHGDGVRRSGLRGEQLVGHPGADRHAE